jgi:hypothetical protein
MNAGGQSEKEKETDELFHNLASAAKRHRESKEILQAQGGRTLCVPLPFFD